MQRAVQAPKNGLVLSNMRTAFSNNIGRQIIQSRGIVAESAAMFSLTRALPKLVTRIGPALFTRAMPAAGVCVSSKTLLIR